MTEPDNSPDEKRGPSQDPFPSTDFDPWAETYDRDVIAQDKFPFDGYKRALDTVVTLAAPRAGMSVLDLGTGTGNLAVRFAGGGCELWCTDFSPAMLDKARLKLPSARFVLHDLRATWPAELERRFDRIISAYVFHHFDLGEKVSLCRTLVTRHLLPGGKLVIADLSFNDAAAMSDFARSVGELWEAEPYWYADESVRALNAAGLNVKYVPVSACAGVYSLTQAVQLHARDGGGSDPPAAPGFSATQNPHASTV
jgi:putative AdoMet-dependent methyltransferase